MKINLGFAVNIHRTSNRNTYASRRLTLHSGPRKVGDPEAAVSSDETEWAWLIGGLLEML